MAFLTTGLGQLVSKNAKLHTNNIEKRINSLQQQQINKLMENENDDIVKKSSGHLKHKSF